MRRLESGFKYLLMATVVLLGACAHEQPLVMRPPPPDLVIIEPQVMVPEVEPEVTDLMADRPGDRALPALAGEIEQIDCKVGVEDLQARMALEARGGQIAGFSYYSKWRPRTCSIDMQQDNPAIKWRLTADGATRVQTPYGSFLIHAEADAYVFEFLDVERRKFCGMDGYTNGTMTIKRRGSRPECSVAGLLDREGLARDEPDDRQQPVAYQGAAEQR